VESEAEAAAAAAVQLEDTARFDPMEGEGVSGRHAAAWAACEDMGTSARTHTRDVPGLTVAAVAEALVMAQKVMPSIAERWMTYSRSFPAAAAVAVAPLFDASVVFADMHAAVAAAVAAARGLDRAPGDDLESPARAATVGAPVATGE